MFLLGFVYVLNWLGNEVGRSDEVFLGDFYLILSDAICNRALDLLEIREYFTTLSF